MKSRVICASLPARILAWNPSMVSCVCTASVPKREFCFKPTLSSMITQEIPKRSSVRTVNPKCSTLPPVSPSKITGFVVTSNVSFKS